MRSCSLTFAVMFLLIGPGCAQTPPAAPEPVSVEMLYNAAQCGTFELQPTVTWIDTTAELTQLYDRLSQSSRPPPQTGDANGGGLFISMGRQRSAGYGLEFDAAYREGDILKVMLTWRKALPGYLQAQVITDPCLLLWVPTRAFREIQIIDQTGQLRLSTTR